MPPGCTWLGIFDLIIIITNYRKKADKLDIYKIQEYISYYKNESSLYDTLMREVF